MRQFASGPELDRPAIAFRPHRFEPRVVSRPPTVFMTPKAYSDMYLLVDEYSEEIGWLGLVDRKGKDFLIHEIFLPKQSCSGAHTELDPNGQLDIYNELCKRPDGQKLAEEHLRFWGHSHVWAAPEPSPRDMDQMREFKEAEADYFIRGILNKRGQMKFAVFYFDLGIAILDVPWMVLFDITSKRRRFWKKEIKDKVTEDSFGTTRYWDHNKGVLSPTSELHQEVQDVEPDATGDGLDDDALAYDDIDDEEDYEEDDEEIDADDDEDLEIDDDTEFDDILVEDEAEILEDQDVDGIVPMPHRKGV